MDEVEVTPDISKGAVAEASAARSLSAAFESSTAARPGSPPGLTSLSFQASPPQTPDTTIRSLSAPTHVLGMPAVTSLGPKPPPPSPSLLLDAQTDAEDTCVRLDTMPLEVTQLNSEVFTHHLQQLRGRLQSVVQAVKDVAQSLDEPHSIITNVRDQLNASTVNAPGNIPASLRASVAASEAGSIAASDASVAGSVLAPTHVRDMGMTPDVDANAFLFTPPAMASPLKQHVLAASAAQPRSSGGGAGASRMLGPTWLQSLSHADGGASTTSSVDATAIGGAGLSHNPALYAAVHGLLMEQLPRLLAATAAPGNFTTLASNGGAVSGPALVAVPPSPVSAARQLHDEVSFKLRASLDGLLLAPHPASAAASTCATGAVGDVLVSGSSADGSGGALLAPSHTPPFATGTVTPANTPGFGPTPPGTSASSSPLICTPRCMSGALPMVEESPSMATLAAQPQPATSNLPAPAPTLTQEGAMTPPAQVQGVASPLASTDKQQQQLQVTPVLTVEQQMKALVSSLTTTIMNELESTGRLAGAVAPRDGLPCAPPLVPGGPSPVRASPVAPHQHQHRAQAQAQYASGSQANPLVSAESPWGVGAMDAALHSRQDSSGAAGGPVARYSSAGADMAQGSTYNPYGGAEQGPLPDAAGDGSAGPRGAAGLLMPPPPPVQRQPSSMGSRRMSLRLPTSSSGGGLISSSSDDIHMANSANMAPSALPAYAPGLGPVSSKVPLWRSMSAAGASRSTGSASYDGGVGGNGVDARDSRESLLRGSGGSVSDAYPDLMKELWELRERVHAQEQELQTSVRALSSKNAQLDAARHELAAREAELARATEQMVSLLGELQGIKDGATLQRSLAAVAALSAAAQAQVQTQAHMDAARRDVQARTPVEPVQEDRGGGAGTSAAAATAVAAVSAAPAHEATPLAPAIHSAADLADAINPSAAAGAEAGEAQRTSVSGASASSAADEGAHAPAVAPTGVSAGTVAARAAYINSVASSPLVKQGSGRLLSSTSGSLRASPSSSHRSTRTHSSAALEALGMASLQRHGSSTKHHHAASMLWRIPLAVLSVAAAAVLMHTVARIGPGRRRGSMPQRRTVTAPRHSRQQAAAAVAAVPRAQALLGDERRVSRGRAALALLAGGVRSAARLVSVKGLPDAVPDAQRTAAAGGGAAAAARPGSAFNGALREDAFDSSALAQCQSSWCKVGRAEGTLTRYEPQW